MASVGLQTGGLEKLLNENVDAVSKIAGPEFKSAEKFNHEIQEDVEIESTPSLFLLSFVYALTVALGGLLWLYFYARMLVKYRDKLNIRLLEKVIQSLGVILCILGVYLGYRGVRLF
jgi:hypothetical protein